MSSKSFKRILAIDPSSRGFGFAVLESNDRLVDWGLVSVRAKVPRHTTQRLENLMKRYLPNVIVTEDPSSNPHRGQRGRKMLRIVRGLAKKARTRYFALSPKSVSLAFSNSGRATKYEIATKIAGRFPELAPRLPRPRKLWTSEAEAMSIFDAVAFATSLSVE